MRRKVSDLPSGLANRASSTRSNRRRRVTVLHWARAVFYPPAYRFVRGKLVVNEAPTEYRLACGETRRIRGARKAPALAQKHAEVTCPGCRRGLGLDAS